MKLPIHEKIIRCLQSGGPLTAAVLAKRIREPRLRVYRCLHKLVGCRQVIIPGLAAAPHARGPKPRLYAW